MNFKINFKQNEVKLSKQITKMEKFASNFEDAALVTYFSSYLKIEII